MRLALATIVAVVEGDKVVDTAVAEEDKAVAVGGKEAEAQVVAVRREAEVVALVAAVQEEARDEISHPIFFIRFPPMGFG